MGMDMYWPDKSYDLGTTVTYKCPLYKATMAQSLSGENTVIFCIGMFSAKYPFSSILSMRVGPGHR